MTIFQFNPHSIFRIPQWSVWTCLFISVWLISGCTSLSKNQQDYFPADRDVSSIPDANPKAEPLSATGNPNSYTVNGKQYFVMKKAAPYQAKGLASWYGMKFHGRRTSSGEPYDVYGMTAAHPSLPLPSYVSVKNLANNKQVVVKVNDRGPFHGNRLIDLSYAAAKKIGIINQGTAPVEVTALQMGPIALNQHTANQPAAKVRSKPVVTTSELSLKSGRKTFVQLGAFSNVESAAKLAYQVKHVVGEPVEVYSNADKKPHVHRVRIGPVASTERISHIIAKLLERSGNQTGFSSPIVIVE